MKNFSKCKVHRLFVLITLILCSLLTSQGAFVALGQNVSASLSGVIIDAVNEEPLIGATIYIEELRKGTAAKRNGEFFLSGITAGKYTLVCSFVGYKSSRQEIVFAPNERKKLTIRLQANTQTLGEVTITAKSDARKIREQAMPVSVLSSAQLAGTVSSVSDILNKTMGVTIRSQGGVGSASRISVRGLEGKRIGFFIDGSPMNDNSDFIDINDIPVDVIERIEIYKGVVPAKFGGSAMGGAINVVIKEYPPRYLDVAYSFESFNTHKTTFVAKRNLPKQGLEFGAGGFYTYSDNNYTMDSPYQKGLTIKRDHDQFQSAAWSISMKARKWYFDELKLEFEGVANKKQIQGIFANVQYAHSKSVAGVIGLGMKKHDFIVDGLDLDFDGAAVLTNYRFIDTAMYRYDWDKKPYAPVHALGGETGTTPSNNRLKKLGVATKLDLNYTISEQHAINLHTSQTFASGKPDDPLRDKALGHKTNFDSKMNSLVAGVSYDYKSPNDKLLNAITGKYYLYSMQTLKADPFTLQDITPLDVTRHYWGLSDAVRYRFTPTLMGKLSLGYEVRTPTEQELIGDGYLLAPSINLLPERGTNLNAGLIYDMKLKNGLFQIEFNAFYSHLKDMIRMSKGIIQTQYQNFGEMRSIGAEIEAKADLCSWLYGYANVTYQDLRDVRRYEPSSEVPNPTRGLRMPNIPYFMANAGLEYHKEDLFGAKNTNTRLFGDASFVEEYFYDFEQSPHQMRRIPRSLRFDLGLEYSILNGALIFSGKLGNITNAKLFSEYNYPMPGRTFSLRLRYVFK